MFKQSTLLLLGAFLCAQSALLAQPGSSSFVHYTTDQGLSNDHVRDVLKDQQGFLWVATQNGLNRFDGHRFRQFFHNPKDAHSLPDNQVRFLTLAPDGSLWVSTATGICRIEPATLAFRRFFLPEHKDNIDDNDQTGRVVFDEAGNGWVCAQQALHCFDPASGEIVSYPLELRDAGRFFTQYDPTGKIWLIENMVISYFDTHKKKLRTLPTDTPGNPLSGAAPLQMAEDQQGKLWVTTWFKGLAWYEPSLDTLLDYPDSNTLTSVTRPDTTADGVPFLWLGGGKHGLQLFFPATGEYQQFPPDPRDPYTHNNYIATAFFKDKKTGTVWIGTEAGLEHYSPKSLRFGRVILPIDASFGQFSLLSAAVQDKNDRSGKTYYLAMWGSGLFKWNRKRNEFTHFHQGNSGLKNNILFCLVQDAKGRLWMGAEGVARFNPRTGEWRHWDCFSEKLNEKLMVMSCLQDASGGLWFGTNRGGLFRYDPLTDRMEEVRLPPEAYNAEGRLRIVNMQLDGAERIWMATYHRPIRLDTRTGEAVVIELKNARPNHSQWSDVHLARSGLIYATSGDCLLELDTNGTVLRKFDQQNGLRSNELYQIEEDDRGCIWVNSSYLLHCLEPKTGTFNYYGTADGLFKNTVTDALTAMPGGEIFIGFQNAFNHFQPAQLRRNLTPPPVAITAMKVMDKERRPTIRTHFRFGGLFSKGECFQTDTMLVLRPMEKIFTIEFTALLFIQPGRNRYAYKLEGFNQDWVYTDRNFATYTNLDGGEYLFWVKAANNDGVWNETGTQIMVKVIPPLTERWYFFAGLGLLAGLILLGIWQYRRQQRRRLEAFRESVARDLHDEMGSTLSSIRFFGEYAKTQLDGDKPQVESVLQRIILSASVLSESMQDIVWAMRRNNDQLEDLGVRMTEFGLRIFEAKNIAFKTHITEGFSGKTLSPTVRRNLFLIFKEAVNNAAKYAEATEVHLFLSLKKGMLFMEISDNGRGIDRSSNGGNGGGNGLQNMQMRANEMKGSLEIISEKALGTTIKVRVKA